jgi:S1-C subfamily serine protease
MTNLSRAAIVGSGLLLPALLFADGPKAPVDVPARVREAEAQRVALVEKVKPAVVAVFAAGVGGGGSGVVVTEDGYALTNFHVVAALGSFLKCGLPSGELYDAVLVGADKVGDIALIKLIPKNSGEKFPTAVLGDSNKVQPGDWSFALGNSQGLSTDYTPTVGFGMISGTHRNVYVADSIQFDTSENPGNSGGPLFNVAGEVIGITGAIGTAKRGPINVGAGCAISINQVKNFMGHLRAGLEVDHASLGAQIGTENDEELQTKLVVKNMIECDASRRGLAIGDQVLRLGDRPLANVNSVFNGLGVYPRGWRIPLLYRNEKGEKREILVRLMGYERQEVQPKPGEGGPPGGPQGAQPKPKPKPPASAAVAKIFEAKPGYANYYFNKLERDRLLAGFEKQTGTFQTVQGDWTIKAIGSVQGRKTVADVRIKEHGAKDGKNPMVVGVIAGVDYGLEPLDVSQSESVYEDPPGSGGLLLALYQYRLFLAYGLKNPSWRDFSHGGSEPYYLPVPEKDRPDYAKLKVDAEVIRTELLGKTTKWYFSAKDQTLLGFEMSLDREKDPCEVSFSDYRTVGGGKMPHHIEVRYGDKTYATLDVTDYKLEPTK